MNRQLTTALDRLHPDYDGDMLRRQELNAEKCPGTVREFRPKDLVYMRSYTRDSKWMPGIIVDVTGPLSYKVRACDGQMHRQHVDQLLDRTAPLSDQSRPEPGKLLGATVSLSSGYHPQSNGQSERANQDLERMLRCLVAKNPSSWSQQLSMVEYAHNLLPLSSTGLSPFKCSVGYQPPIFPSLESEVVAPSAHAFAQRCHRTWPRARETLLQVGRRMKAKASKPPVYVVGQKVWLSTKNIPLRSVSYKFIGLFPVTKIFSPVAVPLKLPPAYRRICPAFHVSKIKPNPTGAPCPVINVSESGPPGSDVMPTYVKKLSRAQGERVGFCSRLQSVALHRLR
ncbi:retrotransposable element [Pimephales promelas]|nr:retrotransposable element [Pimephales promelas]